MKQKALFKEDNTLSLNEEIKKVFETSTFFKIGEIDFGGRIIISFIQFNSLDSLRAEWKDFNSYIAVNYIDNIEDEYSKWNFYIFFMSSENVTNDLKYEIENNKFSSRKIVVHSKDTVNSSFINKMISDHITNEGIDYNVVVDIFNVETFTRNKNINTAILNSLNDFEEVTEAKYSDILNNLEKNLKNEN